MENSKLRVEACGLRIDNKDSRILSCHTFATNYAISGHCKALNFPQDDILQLFPDLNQIFISPNFKFSRSCLGIGTCQS